jgi:hypothetical protein
MEGQLLLQYSAGKFLRQHEAVAGQKPARFAQRAVAGDEIAERHTIAIGEDHVICRRRGQRPVARHGGTKARIFLPDVANREEGVRLITVNEFSGIGSRAIVRNQHLEIMVGLREIAIEHRGQRIGAVVRGDDNRDAHQRSLFSNSSLT